MFGDVPGLAAPAAVPHLPTHLQVYGHEESKWRDNQEVEMALYLCGELHQGTFNHIYARGGGCEKWTVDLSGFSVDKYPEARVRAYPVHHGVNFWGRQPITCNLCTVRPFS